MTLPGAPKVQRVSRIAKRKKTPRMPATVNPRHDDARPLSFGYFESPGQEHSFSAEVVRRLKASVFFRPEVGPDGGITERDLLTVASVVIAAADREIDATQRIRERLAWWNSPLFQKPIIEAAIPADRGTGSGEEKYDSGEYAWFSKYLTLRNIIAVVVAVTLVAWTIFNWIYSENAAEVQHWKDKLTASQADLKGLQDRYDFIDRHSGEQGRELQGVRLELAQRVSDLSGARVDIQRLNDKVAKMTEDLDAATKRAEAAETELSRAKTLGTSAAKEVNAANARAAAAESALAGANARASAAEAQLAELKRVAH